MLYKHYKDGRAGGFDVGAISVEQPYSAITKLIAENMPDDDLTWPPLDATLALLELHKRISDNTDRIISRDTMYLTPEGDAAWSHAMTKVGLELPPRPHRSALAIELALELFERFGCLPGEAALTAALQYRAETLSTLTLALDYIEQAHPGAVRWTTTQ